MAGRGNYSAASLLDPKHMANSTDLSFPSASLDVLCSSTLDDQTVSDPLSTGLENTAAAIDAVPQVETSSYSHVDSDMRNSSMTELYSGAKSPPQDTIEQHVSLPVLHGDIDEAVLSLASSEPKDTTTKMVNTEPLVVESSENSYASHTGTPAKETLIATEFDAKDNKEQVSSPPGSLTNTSETIMNSPPLAETPPVDTEMAPPGTSGEEWTSTAEVDLQDFAHRHPLSIEADEDMIVDKQDANDDVIYIGNSPRKPNVSQRAYPNGTTSPGPAHATSAPQTFAFASASGQHDSDSDGDSVGVASFIERSHNLLDREDSPAKRLKTTHLDDDPHKKAKFSSFNARQCGMISEHIKDKRHKAIQAGEAQVIDITDSPEPEPMRNSANGVVDLTEDDDEIVHDSSMDIVCFGKLDGAKVGMQRIPEHKDHKGWTSDQKQWKALPCRLCRGPAPVSPHNLTVLVRDFYSKVFGNIDVRVARVLAPLMDSVPNFPGLRVDARLDPHPRVPNTHFNDPLSEYWTITLNVFGQRRHGQVIGEALRKKNVFLGAPTGLPYGTEYYNPHALERTKQNARYTKYASNSGKYMNRTNEEVEKDINSVFNRTRNHDELEEAAPPDCVKTELLAHQLQALTFMSEREVAHDITEGEEGHSMSLWRMKRNRGGMKIYYNVITGNEEREPPPPVLGGILADQMGLGKTLEALAHFASTIQEARELNGVRSTTTLPDGTEVDNVGTTLLICPKNVVTNWEEQIEAHLKKGSVKCHVFYGSNRTRDLSILRGSDLVITTYSIVSSELNRRTNSVLKTANWFRIILDEGHMIREQSTLQSKAVCDLHATRRWVLTGTPVQNKLEDLGALVKFLKVKPFDQPAAFAQYIISPIKSGDMQGVPRLRTLVDVITLRRLKDRIDLLPREDKVIRLQFSKEEQILYNWIKQDGKNRVRMMDDKRRKGGRPMGNILRVISCLRMISDHGKELVREDELPDTKGISSDDPLILDDEETEQPPLMAHSAYEMYHLMCENDANNCINCHRKLGSNEEDDNLDRTFGIMLRCYDLVCSDCVNTFKKARAKEAVNGKFKCPTCDDTLDFNFFDLTQTGADDAEAERKQNKLNPAKAKHLGKYEKPATKTLALIAELRAIAEENQVWEHKPPIKSIVFTEWTSHIDLLEVALADHCHKIKYVRLDGSMSRKAQTIAMDRLRDEDEITVMLISIKAGGVGINLTAASRVFVMEPQWNPAAEAQAIDRVHRLGQKREVKVTRFIMAGSIEEQIAKRQEMKTDLADLSMNRKVENAKDKMERFKELFR